MAKPMKMPNGYGSIIKLGGRRRKPYAVRITTSREKNEDGHYVQKYKYLEYFEKYQEALAYLADYNRGLTVKEHESLVSRPTFKEVYERWYEYRTSLKKEASQSLLNAYAAGYKKFEPLYNRKFETLKVSDYQEIAAEHRDKSLSTINNMKNVLKQMYSYAIKYDIVEKDISAHITWEYEKKEDPAHKPFTDDEIKKLWKLKEHPTVQLLLVLIYTGLRISELFDMKVENVHLEESYMVGGMKTDAGKNRIIPIHKAIMPFVEANMNGMYLFEYNGHKLTYTLVVKRIKKVMDELGTEHIPHDTRHTFASLAYKNGLDDYITKLILGHSVQDFTKSVYTHVEVKRLVDEVNKIKI